MDWTGVLNTSPCHKAAYEIIGQIFKDARVLIGPVGVLQEGYLEGRTKKLENNNAGDNNADAA